MAIDLVGHLERLTRRVKDQQFTGAAERMAETLKAGASTVMGGDLTFSGGGGTVEVTPVTRAGEVAAEVNAAYALANTGRHQSRGARGGSWGGFGITAQYGQPAFRAGIDGVVSEVHWGR